MTLAPNLDTERRAPEFDSEAVLAKATAENFSVASRVLPSAIRSQFLAIYGYARLVDDIGDLASGDRLAQLDWAENELDAALSNHASHPIFVAVGKVAREFGIDRAPFVDLIEANRQDQVVTRYQSYEDLVAYCELSANPVGRLVLAVFGKTDEVTIKLSDQVCTALQLVEHWQDVAEDYAAGRIYIPLDDLAAFSVDEDDLANKSASPALRRLMAFECARSRRALEDGRVLVGRVSGRRRVALAGFVAGGLAQLDAIEAANFDVLSRLLKASKGAVVRKTLEILRKPNR